MAELLVIVPTRGRPGKARELIAAFRDTGAAADLVFAVDGDDPEIGAYRALERECWENWHNHAGDRPSVAFRFGPRKSLAGWTNEIAAASARRYRALASMGDDHRPRTAGWDALLLAALDRMGGSGFVYGDDQLQGANLPTACVVSSDIVAALGWLMLPGLSHYFVDNAWKVLGERAGCLRFVPDVVIEHRHPLATGEDPDATYLDAFTSAYRADEAAFKAWQRSERASGDVETVRSLMPQQPPEPCVIGYVHPGTVRAEFCASLLAVCMEGKTPVVSVVAIGSGPNISRARNLVVREFLDYPGSPPWLFMCDTDMWFEADLVDKLVTVADPVDRPVVGALCYSQNPDTEGEPFPTMYELTTGPEGELAFLRYKHWPEGDVVQVTATGAAALLIHRDALAAVEKHAGDRAAPWFRESVSGPDLMGEDLTFCLRLAAAGIPVHVATGVKAGHMKTTMLI